jgi:imidazolonepropionase-like amidohydrolase
MHVEFRCLTDAGLSQQQILQAATYNAARSLGQENEWGSIRPGLVADMVLLEANPLSDIRNAERIAAVVRRGVLHDRADLDRRLRLIQASNEQAR